MKIVSGGKTLVIPSGDGGGNPIGTVISFMGTSAPDGYLVCDGAEYNVSEYTDLAAFFQTQFGASNFFGGDGTATFAVPDMRNLFLRGYRGETEEQLSGDIGERQEATVFPYIASYPKSTGAHFQCIVNDPEDFSASRNEDVQTMSSQKAYFRNFLPEGTGQGSVIREIEYTSRPVNMAVLYCIKAKETQTSGSPSSDDIYSAEETRIGTWVDGKPVYRRAVNGTVSSDAIEKWTTLVEVPNIENLIDFALFVQEPNGHFISMDGMSGNVGFSRESGIVNLFIAHQNFPGRPFYGFISYTKTTG